MEIKERIWQFLKSAGLTDAGAAGLMGNLKAESNFNPKNLQNTYEKSLGYTDDSYTTAVDEGEYDNFSRDSAGYGLAQWTYYTRKAALLALSKIEDKSIGDLDLQLTFLQKEMEKSYAKVWNFLKTTDDVYQATVEVMVKFEGPADQSTTAKNKRYEYSKDIYNEFAEVKEEKVETDEDGIELVDAPAELPEEIQTTEIPVEDSTPIEIVEPAQEEIEEVVEPEKEATPTQIKINNNPQYVNGIATEVVNGIWGHEWEEPVISKIEEVVDGIRTTAGAAEQYYKVIAGDTLTKIANRFNTTIEKIISDNQMAYPAITRNYIAVGWVLKV